MRKAIAVIGLFLAVALLGACAGDEDPGVDNGVTTTTVSDLGDTGTTVTTLDSGTTETTMGGEETTTTSG